MASDISSPPLNADGDKANVSQDGRRFQVADVKAADATGNPDHLRAVPGAATIFQTQDGGGINEAADAQGKLIAFEIPPIGKNWKPTYIRRCSNSKFHVWEPLHGWEPCAQTIGCTGRNHKCHRVCDMFDQKGIYQFWSARERRFIELSVVYCDGIAYQIAFELDGVKFHLLKRWPHEYWHLVDGPIRTPLFKFGFIRATTRTKVSFFHFNLVLSAIVMAIISNHSIPTVQHTPFQISAWRALIAWPLYLSDILFQVSKDSPRISTHRRYLRLLIFKAQRIVVRSVANQENAFQFVTPRPFRRSIRRLRVYFIVRILFTPLDFAAAPVLAYTLGTGLQPDWTNLGILTTICLFTIAYPVSAWYTYRLGERARVKDFTSSFLKDYGSFELKIAFGSTVAGLVAIKSSPLTMVAFAALWVGALTWRIVRTAQYTLFPPEEDPEKSLAELAEFFSNAKLETISCASSVPPSDVPCKACSGPIRIIEKSQPPNLPDTDFSRSFSEVFDEAVKRELVKREQANAEYD
ncbi:hypothetical protein FS837_010918 [Tulasnella sp. UAMH 9824]|nr:hypothetical protein FS837_010918 [Tulasnella sp. UAMH 9824]